MNLSLVMMALGSFRFGMKQDAHQEMQRSSPYRWHAVKRVGRAPALQYGGPGVEEMRLQGVIYPHFRGGLRQVDAMRVQAGTGVPFMMVDGMGWVWKRWVIVNVSDTKSFFMPDGAPRKIEFTVTLQAYGPDGLGGLGGLIKGLF